MKSLLGKALAHILLPWWNPKEQARRSQKLLVQTDQEKRDTDRLERLLNDYRRADEALRRVKSR